MEKRFVAIIQARTGSTRLPGKVLMRISGKPMLLRVVERTKRAKLLNDVIVATTIKASDDAIANLCEAHGWPEFRGSEDDVLDRYFRAAQAYHADVVVRITSDCPLVDPSLIDTTIRGFVMAHDCDYASNTLEPRTFPRGLDVEVFSYSALRKAWQCDKKYSSREHVTPYIRQHPELFRLHSVEQTQNFSNLRWTVDTIEDLALVRRIYAYFGHDHFSWRDVLIAIQDNPEWLQINRDVQQKQAL